MKKIINIIMYMLCLAIIVYMLGDVIEYNKAILYVCTVVLVTFIFIDNVWYRIKKSKIDKIDSIFETMLSHIDIVNKDIEDKICDTCTVEVDEDSDEVEYPTYETSELKDKITEEEYKNIKNVFDK